MLHRHTGTALVVIVALLCGATPEAVLAQPAGEIAERRSDLDDLKKRIRDLQRDMARTEASRSSATKSLADSERAVSRVVRELAKLEAERRDAEKKLALLEGEQRETVARIDARRDELAEWLRRHYLQGGADSMAPLLSAQDPNQLARDAHYLEHLGRARLELIDGLRADLDQTRRRAEEIQSRRDRLAALEGEQRSRRGELQAEQARRKQALAEVSRQLQAQKKQVGTLQQDEQQLAKVIDTLVKRAREVAAREAARRLAAQREAERRAAEVRAVQERAAQARAPERPASPRPRAAEPVVGEVRDAAGPTPTGVRFGQLRGQLRFPVRGELVGRFGAPRADGGTTWKGVFIRAGSGADVRAVAGGEVVFSDWLRGYGNLIIVDHGGDYLSIYGNNDALLKEVGERVGGGDAIASVGAGGVGNESGLYFEIRHQGQPLDPMQWVRLN
ncbi:murein hydrolase activator EnvC family protein [Thauera sp.]|jgi:septal ring factor EnvC (AmiA/AmiB activator)|uniref:murein hydrolase activator EnvC family protein n=1 Tax=Thauera sp. TaxID=1905334 RepID=UPI002A367CD4|nr:peptidoglycan DD-metalloendopeptidase family protein [Thauera sp.]MDX9885640.1 peptidoglycan DD-metalloendopeptidase family protein [Thauera sp.]